MDTRAGIDVSLRDRSVCVLDAAGKIVREAKVPSEPEARVRVFAELEWPGVRIGLEAGPLAQWRHAGLAAGHEVVRLETRHVKAALSAMTIKTDRRDARGIAQARASGLVPPGSCQVRRCPSRAGAARRAQAAAIQAAGRRAQPPRAPARLWPQGRRGQPRPAQSACARADRRSRDAGSRDRRQAPGPRRAVAGVHRASPPDAGHRAAPIRFATGG
jgi:hypothetical protein